MMRSMFSGVSGIIAHQTKMDVIGNNISNVNTIGFKSGRVTFQEVFSQTLRGSGAPDNATGRGGTNPMQVGLGLAVAAVDTVMTRGSIQRTDNPTDLSIDGEGFFIVKGGSSEAFKFTRAGNFTMDKDGNLVAGGGNSVYGWQDYGEAAQADGTFQFDTEKPVEPINLYSDVYNKNKKMISAKATTTASFAGNFDAQEGVVESAAGALSKLKTTMDDAESAMNTAQAASVADPTNVALQTAYTAAQTAYTTAQTAYNTSKTEYDTNVAAGTITTLDKTKAETYAISAATAKEAMEAAKVAWDKEPESTALKAAYDAAKATSDLEPASLVIPYTVYDSLGNEYKINLNFWKTTSGSTSEWKWTVSSSADIISDVTSSSMKTLTFDNKGSLSSTMSDVNRTPTINLTTGTSAGSETFPVKLDFTKLTQYSADSSVKPTNIDGYPSGNLTTFNISPDGVITGIYSNGQQQPLGLLALAGFENPAGLKKIGDNMYITSTNSGIFKNGVKPGTQGLGSLNPGTLEMSNVDLSKEFTDMIVTQRGFQANSRIITTSDEMLQELVNLKK